jgi:hypothetical protein
VRVVKWSVRPRATQCCLLTVGLRLEVNVGRARHERVAGGRSCCSGSCRQRRAWRRRGGRGSSRTSTIGSTCAPGCGKRKLRESHLVPRPRDQHLARAGQKRHERRRRGATSPLRQSPRRYVSNRPMAHARSLWRRATITLLAATCLSKKLRWSQVEGWPALAADAGMHDAQRPADPVADPLRQRPPGSHARVGGAAHVGIVAPSKASGKSGRRCVSRRRARSSYAPALGRRERRAGCRDVCNRKRHGAA